MFSTTGLCSCSSYIYVFLFRFLIFKISVYMCVSVSVCLCLCSHLILSRIFKVEVWTIEVILLELKHWSHSEDFFFHPVFLLLFFLSHCLVLPIWIQSGIGQPSLKPIRMILQNLQSPTFCFWLLSSTNNKLSLASFIYSHIWKCLKRVLTCIAFA